VRIQGYVPVPWQWGNRPAAVNRKVTGANRPVRKLSLDFVALKWTTKQSKRRDWQCILFLGWTCSDAAILSAGTLTCMASALTFIAHFDNEGGGSRLFRNVKNAAHSQTEQKKTDSIDRYILPIAWLCSSWIYWPLKMGRIGCPETSARNYHYTLHNIPQERGSHLTK